MTNIIQHRVEELRGWMAEHDLQAYVIVSTDPHASEYPPCYWECRKWISGFSGSAGTAVVTMEEAALWTDSRYFIAAHKELEGTPFMLMKDGLESTPDIADWIGAQLGTGEKVGIDGKVYALKEALALQDKLQDYGLSLVADFSAPDDLWTDRPALPSDEIRVQPMEWAGETVESKVGRLMDEVERRGCEQMLVSQLDEVAWLLNLRGSDVHCNPVFVAYALVSRSGTALFCNPSKINSEVEQYLNANNICVYDYYKAELMLMRSDKAMMLSDKTNVAMANLCMAAGGGRSVVCESPIARMKAIKNEAELRGMERAMEQDGVAMVRWLRWMEGAIAEGKETERSVDAKLSELRSEFADFRGLSFDTIAGYQEHGAIVHYEADEGSDAALRTQGMLLVDSGAQYECGTTDITRTLLLGSEATEEEKRVYTLVLKGHIALSNLKFPRGASGTQIDMSARAAMWREGYNYGHGTGHGVGAHLCVHEGPHQIRMNYVAAPLLEGMTVTDEPGIYLEGRFGVRIENVLLCVPYKQTEFGCFVGFRPLTLCPIDVRPIDWEMMTTCEIDWLNDYHKEVAERLMPLLQDEADRAWLSKACAPIEGITEK